MDPDFEVIPRGQEDKSFEPTMNASLWSSRISLLSNSIEVLDHDSSNFDEIESLVNDNEPLVQQCPELQKSVEENDNALVNSVDSSKLIAIELNTCGETENYDQENKSSVNSGAEYPLRSCENTSSSVGTEDVIPNDERYAKVPGIVVPEVIIAETDIEASDFRVPNAFGTGTPAAESTLMSSEEQLIVHHTTDESLSGEMKCNEKSEESPSDYYQTNVSDFTEDMVCHYESPPAYYQTNGPDFTEDIICHYESQDEFITVKNTLPLKVDQLNCSARLFYANLVIHLHNEGCLMVVDNDFVAKVKILDINPLKGLGSFEQAKIVMFWQLRIDKVLVDDLIVQRDRARNRMLETIDIMMQTSAASNQRIHDAMVLLGLLQKYPNFDNLCYTEFCRLLQTDEFISSDLNERASVLLHLENSVSGRDRFLSRFGIEYPDDSEALLIKLDQFRTNLIDNRSKLLLEKTPVWLQKLLHDVPKEKVIYISESDVKLFADISSVLSQNIFEKPLTDLAKRWIQMIKSVERNEIISLTSPTYFFLCKSLEELIIEISSRAEHQPSELLLSSQSGWHPLKTIKWKMESNYTRCLQQEYNFIMKLIEHFDLTISGTRNPFNYQARLHGDSIPDSKESLLNNIIRQTKQLFKSAQPVENPLGITDEFYVWFCLLDDVLASVLPITGNELNLFDHVIQNFVKFICDATVDQMETIRVITHNTVRFIVQTFPRHDQFAIEDREAIQKQLDTINRAVLESPNSESANIFRDLIDVFNCYWKNRREIIEILPAKIALDEMQQVKNNVLKIVLTVLEKQGAAEQIVQIFRVFNDYLIDLNDVSFDWLIKTVPLFNMKSMVKQKLIEPVDNKWSGTENQSFRIINVIKFYKLSNVLMEGDETVRHYMIEIINALLSIVQNQLNRKHWKEGDLVSPADQLHSSSVLIAAIRDSLLYLHEQAEYVSFDLFFDESLKPFMSVGQQSVSLDDFCMRIDVVKQSFWYIRKQNEISIEKALQLYLELNESEPDRELIMQAYQRYTEQFEFYMEKSSDQTCDNREDLVVTAVKSSVGPLLFENWDARFKQEMVPKILAGLAAAWSLMVSKDVASTGKYLKPHCIQILCILRLLSVDNADKGIAKHLAQVLTGQGKSLVLGLVASFLALTGHVVQIACYNKYLVDRDQNDFKEFFKLFEINGKVTYGTFESLANKIIAPKVDGVAITLRDLVTNKIIDSGPSVRKKLPASFKRSSVLLMDEVDVFFTDEYYGSAYYPVANPEIIGLDKIQEKIWSLVCTGHHDRDVVTSEINRFISTSQFVGAETFRKFYRRTETFEMLEYFNNIYRKKTFTTKTFFDSHLRLMVDDAINVSKIRDSGDVMLSPDGAILQKYKERYVNFYKVRYSTIFNYFRLKKEGFMAKVKNLQNYGYFNLRCGAISYAMLPKDFSLILGVTGTLTALNQHEKATIKDLYNIQQSSIMPTFFGCANLLFDPVEDFKYFPSESEWMGHIFSQANASIGSKRAVIVFFEDDSALDRFREEYSGQFDRLNVITENTTPDTMNKIINESGVSRTITLATRGMGRGVDYQSSVAVEQNGGVHVIQSFFSLDVKEETQIKGRTARKDNKGSYELIVCRQHLNQRRLAQGSEELTYAIVDAARQDLSLKRNQKLIESIEREKTCHVATMEYLKSFFG